jgi:hypothetical protein
MAEEAKKREEVKQFVEKFLNNMLETDILSSIDWVIQAVPLSDLRDVAIGYIIGVTFERLRSYGEISEILDGSKLVSDDYRNVMAVFREKLPKIIEKVEKEYCE